ncbi:MAG: cytochrome c [Bacteroidetes bacterium]|nr:cytochrome c [Bacteroidota bacterium]MCY4204999.1 cytochrome c [Bacteroidota bacterium]
MEFKSGLQHCFFVILIGLILSVVAEGGIAQDSAVPDGEPLYMTRCASCHQANGEGISGVFPPLNEVDWVTGDKGRLIRLVLDGVMGPLQVGDMVYTGAMPPWKTFLNDQEMAALLTYIRTAWDNDASAVTENEVRLVREATNDRKKAWTTEELEDEINQGIPGSFGFIISPRDTTGTN